jgi:hypothetical protein
VEWREQGITEGKVLKMAMLEKHITGYPYKETERDFHVSSGSSLRGFCNLHRQRQSSSCWDGGLSLLSSWLYAYRYLVRRITMFWSFKWHSGCMLCSAMADLTTCMPVLSLERLMSPEHIHKEMHTRLTSSNAHHPPVATPKPPWQETNRLVCAWTDPFHMTQGHINTVQKTDRHVSIWAEWLS